MPVDAPLYPVNLVVAGRRCLVVGGGTVAARKIEGLLAAGAKVTVVAPEINDEIRAMDVAMVQRAYATPDLDDVRLVFVATDDPSVTEAVHADADAAGLWVNAADEPVHCSFMLPAVVRRGGLTVAVGTGGRSPALASWLRRKLEIELGPEYEVLLDLLAEAREHELARARAEGVTSATTSAADWQRALDSDMLELIRAGEVPRARERLQACLSSS